MIRQRRDLVEVEPEQKTSWTHSLIWAKFKHPATKSSCGDRASPYATKKISEVSRTKEKLLEK